MLKHLIFAVFSLDRTHANFRRSEMDELYTSGNWVIGSQGNGYGNNFKILYTSVNVYRSLRSVHRFSLQYLWAIRITEKPYTLLV